LVASDAAQLAKRGRLAHLRLQSSMVRDLRALATTPLGARLETLYVPASGRYSLAEEFPATMPALRRFETTWLSDSEMQMLAQRAPRLAALELRPLTQATFASRVEGSDGTREIGGGGDGGGNGDGGGGGGDESEEEKEDDSGDDEAFGTSMMDTMARVYGMRRATGIREPPAGSGLVRSLARHLTHLRELVLRRHHADLRPLTALAVLQTLVCCDRPRVADATKWPETMASLVDLRVIDITYDSPGASAVIVACRTRDLEQKNAERRRLLCRRFPALQYLRFVRVEDEAVDDDGEPTDNDDRHDPVRCDQENGVAAVPTIAEA
jgi:hypothetical protein